MAAGCASERAHTPETYVVQPRDTLYSIAWRHDLDYRDLARWNHIGADYRIAVGEVLSLKPGNYRAPQAAARVSSAPSNSARAGSAGSGDNVAPKAASSAAVPPSSAATGGAATGGAADTLQPCGWMWPAAHASAPRPVPGGGILLLGTLGQPIRAACAGRVVYAGSGIRGYGNLIIIKHGDTLLTAYAHTVQLDVHEGQEVAAGEEIAHMGTGAHNIAALYFEIRVNGKPVDPLPLLRGGN
jgi:lipoprotein NlpD